MAECFKIVRIFDEKMALACPGDVGAVWHVLLKKHQHHALVLEHECLYTFAKCFKSIYIYIVTFPWNFNCIVFCLIVSLRWSCFCELERLVTMHYGLSNVIIRNKSCQILTRVKHYYALIFHRKSFKPFLDVVKLPKVLYKYFF